jgi:predicted signal transduction protein with EAL and GGDEF domain
MWRMGELTQQRFRIEHELRRASLPVNCGCSFATAGRMPAGNWSVRGAGALAAPRAGPAAARVFIPIAEESDLIIELENWVIRETCRQLAREEMAGYPLHLSVNISPRHFRQSGFVNWLLELMPRRAMTRRT